MMGLAALIICACLLKTMVVMALPQNPALVGLTRQGHIVSLASATRSRVEKQKTGGFEIRTEAGSTVFDFDEGQPTKVRFMDQAGCLRFARQFRLTVNLQISENGQYAVLFDGCQLVVLDLVSGNSVNYPASVCFAVDDRGRPVYYAPKTGRIHYRTWSRAVGSVPVKMLFYKNIPVICAPDGVLAFSEGQLAEVRDVRGTVFDAQVVRDKFYFVEKWTVGKRSHFVLSESDDLVNFATIGATTFDQPNGVETHEPTRAPLHYWESSFPSLVRNAYAQIQEWGDLYLHPGVDLFEAPYTEAYAVDDGIVRAILTTGGEEYWRIAIESLDIPGEGYLYAHLNQDSFPFTVGDTVAAGDVVGTLFPAYSFEPHLHFARISPDGEEWNGVWWTTDNPLVDITNMADTLDPVIEYALGNDLFAFRNQEGDYLDPLHLSGEVEIIAKCCDYAYAVDFYSRIPVFDIQFRIYAPENPDSAVYQQFSFAMDMPLDTYFSDEYQMLVLNTVYSRDATCFSTNNNDARDFFFIITNSDGDSVITAEDSLRAFNTTDLPYGMYLLEVEVHDASGREATANMVVGIDNGAGIAQGTGGSVGPGIFKLEPCHPNPFNSRTVLSFQLETVSLLTLKVYDMAGRDITSLLDGWYPAGSFEATFVANDLPSGIFIARMMVGNSSQTQKTVLLR